MIQICSSSEKVVKDIALMVSLFEFHAHISMTFLNSVLGAFDGAFA